MEPVTTSVAAGSVVAASTSASTSASAAGGASAATIAKQADSIRRLTSAFVKTVGMKAVGDSEIVDEFASPIYAGLAAVPTDPSTPASGIQASSSNGVIPEVVAPSSMPKGPSFPPVPGRQVPDLEGGVKDAPAIDKSPRQSPAVPTPPIPGAPTTNPGVGDSAEVVKPEPIPAEPGDVVQTGRQQVQTNAAKAQKLPVEKPEIKELIDRYYEAPTIKEQLATGQDKIVIERNVLEEKVSVSGDKRTAFCLIEERVVDRKYLEHGNLTDMISEVRHGNIPTVRQLYLAVIDLMDLATFKVFRPLLARVKLESATYRMRQLTADFERKELEPSLQREDRNEFKLDRKIDDRSWFKTDHVVEKIAHKDVETSKQLEIVATNVTDLCTVELKKSSVEGFIARRQEMEGNFNDVGAIPRLEGMLPPETIASVNKKAMAWVQESLHTTTSEYSTTETFHRYGVDFGGAFGKKIETSEKVVTKEVKNTLREYLSPSDKICLEDIRTYDEAFKKFATLQQTAQMEFDPQVVESYIEPSEGVTFDEGWITYIPGGSIANLGFKSDLGCDLTGWDYFWAAVDVATIAVAVATCGTSSAITAPVALGAKTVVKAGAKAVAKVAIKSTVKATVRGGAKTVVKQSGKVVLKGVGKKVSSKAIQAGASKVAATKAIASSSTKKTAGAALKESAKAESRTTVKAGAKKTAAAATKTEVKQTGKVQVKNSGKAGTKAKPSADVSSPDVTYKNIPRNGGEWTGTPGDSTWKPNPKATPTNPKANPTGKTNAQILKENNMKGGIKFEKGYPNFSDAAQEQVKVTGMTTNRAKNMAQADSRLAAKVRAGKANPEITNKLKQMGVDPKNATKGDIARMRKKYGLTWHEHQNKQSMQLISKELHGTVSHKGGISALKQEEKLASKASTSTASDTAKSTAKTAEGAAAGSPSSAATSTTKS